PPSPPSSFSPETHQHNPRTPHNSLTTTPFPLFRSIAPSTSCSLITRPTSSHNDDNVQHRA
ncbi:unnamed protein product, partial [Dovyalis caffra]